MVNVLPCVALEDDGVAANEVESGLDNEPFFKFRVIEPDPPTVTAVGSPKDGQDNPPEQVQLANVYPTGTCMLGKSLQVQKVSGVFQNTNPN
jgi:hypothetical protein